MAKRGQKPRGDSASTKIIFARVTDAEFQKILKASQGVTISEHVRRSLGL